jgi:hypothetical protein
MTSTPLTRDLGHDVPGGDTPDVERLLTPSRFERPAYWARLALINFHTAADALDEMRRLGPSDPRREVWAAARRAALIEAARNNAMVNKLT